MSEPTYRVELQHKPENQPFPWVADIYRMADDEFMASRVSDSREEAFARAVQYVYALNNAIRQHPSTVYLSEDGDLLDPHEVQR